MAVPFEDAETIYTHAASHTLGSLETKKEAVKVGSGRTRPKLKVYERAGGAREKMHIRVVSTCLRSLSHNRLCFSIWN